MWQYGTGAFLLLNVGEKPVISTHGLMSTVAFDFSPQGIKPAYALEGSIAVAGSSVKFLMNNLGFFRDSHKISELAQSVPDNGGVVFVTAFSGVSLLTIKDSTKLTTPAIRSILDRRCKRHHLRRNSPYSTRPHRPRHLRSHLLPDKSYPRLDAA